MMTVLEEKYNAYKNLLKGLVDKYGKDIDNKPVEQQQTNQPNNENNKQSNIGNRIKDVWKETKK
jgi:hypothetical protein